MLAFNQWEAINCKQITRWQHVSRLKLAHSALGKKIIIAKNATAYTWDWYCHLVIDRASLFTIFKMHCSIVGCLATSSQNVASILRSPWLTKPTGKMDLINSHFDKVGYHQEEIKLMMNTSL